MHIREGLERVLYIFENLQGLRKFKTHTDSVGIKSLIAHKVVRIVKDKNPKDF